MADPRQPGMDHDLYPYSAIPARPALNWPGGWRLAVWIVLHLELWELQPPEGAIRDGRFRGEFGNFFPDYRTYSTREYGNRVGVFRIFDVLDRHQVPVTVAANAALCRERPRLIEECLRRGYEIAAHGSHATRMITAQMTPDQEQAHIDDAMAENRGGTPIHRGGADRLDRTGFWREPGDAAVAGGGRGRLSGRLAQ